MGIKAADRRAYLTAKKRESRARARAEGRCIVCTHNPATPGLATCQECRDKVTASRALAKATASETS